MLIKGRYRIEESGRILLLKGGTCRVRRVGASNWLNGNLSAFRESMRDFSRFDIHFLRLGGLLIKRGINAF